MRSTILGFGRSFVVVLAVGAAGGAGCGGGGGGPRTGGAGASGAAGTVGGAGTSGAAGSAGSAATMGGAGTSGAAGTVGGAGTTGAGATTGAAGTTGVGGVAGTMGITGAGGSTTGGAGRGGTTGAGGVAGTTGVGGQGGAAGRGGTTGAAGRGGTGGAGGMAGGTAGTTGAAGSTAAVGVACTGTAPWVTTGTAAVNLTVNAGSRGAAWSRFYEGAVATDHANTILTTAYGRNIQGALKKGHDQAGFRYARFHGIFNDDIGVYSEPGGTPTYNWSRLDQVYDAVIAAGMRPFVEVSFTPRALATNTAQNLNSLWYNNMSPNISQPRDWTRWQTLMAEFVRHLESRYGAAEVRNNWYFEVWNEASWMYAPGPSAYNELYRNTVTGLLQGDAQLKVGGPADTGGNSPYAIPSLIDFARTNSLKLDFISFHRYGDDGGAMVSDANGMVSYHNTMIVDMLKTKTFTGELWNTEFGPSYMPHVARDNESSASFIAKLMHLIGTDATRAAPNGYGYWALSDLYEEIDTGTARAYREGNYGLLLKGDPAITESFDVPKPAFNAFRVLHLMGANQLPVTGGSAADSQVNAAATISADGQSVQVLVYNHVAGGAANSSTSSLVSLTVNGIPFASSGSLRVRHYMIDRTHSNSYQTWVTQGKPAAPSQAQWVSLRDTGELCSYSATQTATGGTWTVRYPQNVYGVSLFVLSP